MAHNPRQAVIEFLSAPVAASSSPLVLTGDGTAQKGTRRTGGGLAAIAATIRFLKERETTHFYACIVTFTDSKGQVWEMVCLAQQDDIGNWLLRNGSGGAPHDSRKASEATTTHAELISGPGVEGGYYAGGYVVGPDASRVRRVRLIAADDTELEDTIDDGDDGRVLFVSEHVLQEPVRAQFHPT